MEGSGARLGHHLLVALSMTKSNTEPPVCTCDNELILQLKMDKICTTIHITNKGVVSESIKNSYRLI